MSEEIETGTALVVVENLNPVTVFAVEGGSQSVIDSIRSQVANLKLDISTEKGRKEIKSVVRKLGSTKARLDEAGKELKADIQKQVDLVDGERKKIRDDLEKLQEEIRKPLTEYEEIEERRISVRELRIEQLFNLRTPLIPDADVQTIQAHLDQITEFEVFDWQEFSMRAKATADESRLILEGMKARRIKHDADQAELAELRRKQEEQAQKDRDAQIAKDAAEAATKAAAEKAAEDARIAKEAADKLIADAEAAKETERVAKEQAETSRVNGHKSALDQLSSLGKIPENASAQVIKDRCISIAGLYEGREWQEFQDQAKDIMDAMNGELELLYAAAEKREADAKTAADKAAADAATKAEQDRIAAAKKADDDAEAARQADKEHRGKINRLALDAIKEIISAFKETGNDPSQAIVEAIVRGKIPNVTIKY
jgi:hypothetical protein